MKRFFSLAGSLLLATAFYSFSQATDNNMLDPLPKNFDHKIRSNIIKVITSLLKQKKFTDETITTLEKIEEFIVENQTISYAEFVEIIDFLEPIVLLRRGTQEEDQDSIQLCTAVKNLLTTASYLENSDYPDSLPLITRAGSGQVSIFGLAAGAGILHKDASDIITSSAIIDGDITVGTIDANKLADATLIALAGYNTNGLLTQTAADTFTGRTITGTASQITVTDGDGVAGNPTLSLPTDIVVTSTTTASLTLGADTGNLNTSQAALILQENGAEQSRIQTDAVNTNVDIQAGTGNSLTLQSGGANDRIIISSIGASSFATPDSGNTATVTVAAGAGTAPALQINGNTAIASGNLDIPTSSSTTGSITQNSIRLLHTFGTNNTFYGNSAGNFNASLTGSANVGIGTNALAALAAGTNNIAVGKGALDANTDGSNNVGIGTDALGMGTASQNNTAIGYMSLLNNGVSDNTAVGYQTLMSNGLGLRNTAVGVSALASNTSANDNTAVGYSTLSSNTSGINNTAIGTNALTTNGANNNTALGYSAGSALTTGVNNIMIGAGVTGVAAEANTCRIGTGIVSTFIGGITGTTIATPASVTLVDANGQLGTDTTTINLATGATTTAINIGTNTTNKTITIGSDADIINLDGIIDIPATAATLGVLSAGAVTQAGTRLLHTYGTNNIFYGNSSGNFSLTGTNNVGIGTNTLTALTSGASNTAIGYNALAANNASNITAVGASSLAANTTGTNNSALGYQALMSNTNAVDNTAIGIQALSSSNANSNTAIGARAALNLTTGTDNVAIGRDSLRGDGITAPTGVNNVAVGGAALQNITNCSSNVAIGHSSLNATTSGSQNVAIGASTLAAVTTENSNTAVGYIALTNNAASGNTAVGYGALTANTSGVRNAALGYNALSSISTGSDCTSIGYNTLVANTADFNTAIGSNALAANTGGTLPGGTANSGLGYNALLTNSTGYANTAIGYEALKLTTVSLQTAVGAGSLANVSTGSSNTALGWSSGNTVTTGSNNILLGKSADVGTATFSNCIVIGSASSSASNQTKVGFFGGFTSQTSCFIDGIRGKASIAGGIANAVQVDSAGQVIDGTTSSIRYKENVHKLTDQSFNVSRILDLDPVSFSWKNDFDHTTDYGLIAEEVKNIVPEMTVYDSEGLPHGVQYKWLPIFLLQLLKEQKTENEILKQQVQNTIKLAEANRQLIEKLQAQIE